MRMKRWLSGPICLALCNLACGSPRSVSPTGVTPNPSGLVLMVGITSPDGTSSGLHSPVWVGFRVTEPTGLGGSIEAASSRVLDSGGTVLAEAQLVQPASILAGGYGDVRQQLTWPSGATGRRLEFSVTAVDGRGQRQTFASGSSF
jgi:hypothetical protein